MEIKEFLKKKDIEFSAKRYGIDAMGSMALGLFSSLVVGLIMKELGTRLGFALFAEMGVKAMSMSGACIGIAVAYGLKAPPLVLFSSAITGFAGNEIGGPAGAFVGAVIGAEFGKIVSKETTIDIILTPVVTIFAGVGAGLLVGPFINSFIIWLGSLIMWATELMPFLMGIIIAVIVGLALTGPISSAALCIMLNLGGIAAGAACAGGCAQTIGFAVASYRENKTSGLIAQGLGTSMLQIPNIVKNPAILVPAVVASAVAGPVSSSVFKMENISTGAGMGTSGLVGQFGAISAMGTGLDVIIKILVTHFIIPAIVSFAVSEIMRKKGFIKPGDMKLDL